MSPDELQQKLAETRKELFTLRFQSATGSLEDTTRLHHARRDIARILTVQFEHAKARS
jgi:large subunit ribosomal protein L29